MDRNVSLSIVVVLLLALYLVQNYAGHDGAASQSLNLATPTPTGSDTSPIVTPTPGDNQNTPSPQASYSSGGLKDGQYTGSEANAFYGFVKVKATISGGKLADVALLEYPNSRGHTIAVSQMALPMLRQEAIQAQSSQVDVVSGATDTSEAFKQSLSDALQQAGGS
jgi:uncharacterized protein with FMN-binding domain